MSEHPQVFRLRQYFDRPRIEDVAGEVELQLASLALDRKIQAGQSVAITAGSRGIANIAVIIRAVVDHVRRLGGQPFIVPAMGSHGGGTADGQQSVLDGYDITEKFCGCPVRSSMETVVVCQASEGFPVYFDRTAHKADHVFVVNRIKPHTDFGGDIESGLLKMLLIGLGKHDGARIYHRAFKDFTFDQIVRSVSREVISRCPITAGLAIIENGYDETARIQGVQPDEFETRESELLKEARHLLPRLPFDQADLLLIDRIGKNISGTGMDTNVVGRKFGIHQAGADETPKIRYIAVRGLTEATHGNATGLGLSEFCLARVLEQRNENTTRINSLTGGRVVCAMTPVDYVTDRELLDAALSSIGLTEPVDARLLWIRDTLHLAELECSATFWDEAQERPDLEILSRPRTLPINQNGWLPDSVCQFAPVS